MASLLKVGFLHAVETAGLSPRTCKALWLDSVPENSKYRGGEVLNGVPH